MTSFMSKTYVHHGYVLSRFLSLFVLPECLFMKRIVDTAGFPQMQKENSQ